MSDTDWTVDPKTGRSNSSPLFVELTTKVADIIRNGAHSLLAGQVELVAGGIVAQLAHVYGLTPILIVDPIDYERRIVSLMRGCELRAFDDTTAEESAQWQAAAGHLGHAANCMSLLDYMAERKGNDHG